MSAPHFLAGDTPVLTDISGDPLRALAGETEWTLEDREDSTNRLTITIPLSVAADVVADGEVIFQHRRFRIADVDRSRVSGTAVVEADETQVELADIAPAKYALDGSTLSDALTKALIGTLWTSGGVYDDTGTYFSDFENESVTRILRFLQSQSNQWVHFDSMNRVVTLVDSTPPPLDRVFTYGAGVSDVKKRETPPKYTVIEPTGRAGMTIANVNGGSKTVEDFGWYTGLGMTLPQARARFTKKQFWDDDRYVYAMNLLRDAQAKLAEDAYPQITYEVDAEPGEIDDVRLGDRAWVVDEVLGAKLAVRVARVVTSSDGSASQLDLDYLPRSLGSTRSDERGDSTVAGTDMVQFQAKNQQPVILGSAPVPVLQTTVQVIADTAFQVGVTVRLETTAQAEIGGYFLLGGTRIDPEIRQTAAPGWWTFGLPFLVTQVTAGSKNFDLYMTVSAGSATVDVRDAEMFIVTRGAMGGLSNERPGQNVQDHVGMWFTDLPGPSDAATAIFPPHLNQGAVDAVGEWFTLIDSPVDVAAAMFKPSFSVAGTTITLTGMIPGQVFVVRVEFSGGVMSGMDSFTADGAGGYVLDLATHFALAAGNYSGELVDFHQPFTFTA